MNEFQIQFMSLRFSLIIILLASPCTYTFLSSMSKNCLRWQLRLRMPCASFFSPKRRLCNQGNAFFKRDRIFFNIHSLHGSLFSNQDGNKTIIEILSNQSSPSLVSLSLLRVQPLAPNMGLPDIGFKNEYLLVNQRKEGEEWSLGDEWVLPTESVRPNEPLILAIERCFRKVS